MGYVSLQEGIQIHIKFIPASMTRDPKIHVNQIQDVMLISNGFSCFSTHPFENNILPDLPVPYIFGTRGRSLPYILATGSDRFQIYRERTEDQGTVKMGIIFSRFGAKNQQTSLKPPAVSVAQNDQHGVGEKKTTKSLLLNDKDSQSLMVRFFVCVKVHVASIEQDLWFLIGLSEL